MFILDSLMVSGIRWALETALTAAEAEMNDDTVLREHLLEAEMRRELGEMTDEEFRRAEADLLSRIRAIRERREGGSGPLAFSGEALTTDSDGDLRVEATVAGDFHAGEPRLLPSAVPEAPPSAGETEPDGGARRAGIGHRAGASSGTRPPGRTRRASRPSSPRRRSRRMP